MKISLKLTAVAWSQVKIDFFRLNYRLGKQGKEQKEVMLLVDTIDSDQQLNYPPLKLTILLQAVLSQSAKENGCTLGTAFLEDLIQQGWVVIDDKERQALLFFSEPLPFAVWQAELIKQLQIGHNQSLGELTQSVLWQNAKGQLTIDTLACAVLQQQARLFEQARFNLTLVQIRLLQESQKDWFAPAIKLLSAYTKSKSPLDNAGKANQLLASYHLCEIYRLLLQNLTLQPFERQALEAKWKVNYQRLQQAECWQGLKTHHEFRLSTKPQSILFYYYQEVNIEMKRITHTNRGAKMKTELHKEYRQDEGSWLAVISSGIMTGAFGLFLYVLIHAAMAKTATVMLLPALGFIASVTLCSAVVFVMMLAYCIKDIIEDWKAKKQPKEARLVFKEKPIDGLNSLEVTPPAYRAAQPASSSKSLTPESSTTANETSQQTLGLGQFLNRFGWQRRKSNQSAKASTHTNTPAL